MKAKLMKAVALASLGAFLTVGIGCQCSPNQRLPLQNR